MKTKILVICFVVIHFIGTSLITVSLVNEEKAIFNKHTNIIDTNLDSVISEPELKEYEKKQPPNYEDIFNKLHSEEVEKRNSKSVIKVIFALTSLFGLVYFKVTQSASKVYFVIGIVSIPISVLLAIEMILMGCMLLLAGICEKRVNRKLFERVKRG